MKRWIRWQGLVVFAAVLILGCLFWFLIVDSLVKWSIEKVGTKAVGAKVELAKADLSLFPAGLTLQGLQVANPNEPMKNAVEIARIACTMDGLNLLRRKIIIPEMRLEGVRLGTARAHSGALPKTEALPSQKKEKKPFPALEIPSFDLPSVEKILQKEGLKSVQAVESFRAEVTAEKEKWPKRLAELPDQKKIEDYRKRVDKLKSATGRGVGGIAGGLGEAVDLQKEIQKDLERIQTAQKEFTGRFTSLKDRLSKLEKAPLEDLETLKKKYSPSSLNAGNWTRLLLEGKAQSWVEKALWGWGKLKPVLERVKERKGKAEVVKPLRGKGLDVRFPEAHPLPDFLIQRLQASLQLDLGDLTGRAEDITPDPNILGRPLKFMVAGEKLKAASLLKLEGVLDHIHPERASDSFKLRVEGYRLKGFNLSPSDSFPLRLTEGLVILDLQGVLKKETIAAEGAAAVYSAHFDLGEQKDASPLRTALTSAFSEISNFKIHGEASGPPEDVRIKVSSDLDTQVQKAVQSQVQKFAAKFEKDLSAAIYEKVGGPLNEAKSSLGSLGDIGKELENRLQQLTGLQSKGTPAKIPGGLKLPFR